MDWLANIDGIEFLMNEIWPQIAAAEPAAKVLVVGRNPPERLVEAARRRALPWTFTGFVDDIRPYVHASDAYLIPLRIGSGTRIKAYEAMAMGCPVVSTTIGVEGLPLDPDHHYLRADSPGAFASAVVRLLADRALRRQLARAARDYVQSHFGWKGVATAFEGICASVQQRATR
jgi:glycosyltransferase involved in cell wall biosynthesis